MKTKPCHTLLAPLRLFVILLACMAALTSCSTPPEDGGTTPPVEILPRNPDGTVNWEEAERIAREIWEEANPEPMPTPAPAPTPAPNPTPEPTPAPPPSGVDTGRGGGYNELCANADSYFLWKPISESTGKVFILTPHDRRLETTDTTIIDGQNREEETSWHDSLDDCVNGGNLHWKGDKQGAQYPGPVRVREETRSGHIFEYIIPNPAARYKTRDLGVQIQTLTTDGITVYDLSGFEDTEEPGEDEGAL